MQIIARRVLKPLQKVRILLKDLPPDPTPEQVKKFRIQLRRTEAVLDGFGLASCRVGRRLLRHERPLRVRAGKIHDMDILIVLAEFLQARGAEQCRTELLELIGAKRYRHARKLRQTAVKTRSKLVKDLEKCESRIRIRIGPKVSAEDRTVMAAKLAALILQVCSELAHYPRLSRTNLHLFRVRIRYFRRLLRMANKQRTPLYCALAEGKDAIGDWHDWERLLKIAHELEGHPGYRALLAEIRTVSAVKLRRAMQISQELRARYLSKLLITKNQNAAPPAPKADKQLAA